MSDFVPRTIESSGKSIDEAIFNGLQELGVSIDEVTITTVQQSQKGVFGIGYKPCIVRLVERRSDYDEILATPSKVEKSAQPIERKPERHTSEPVRAEQPRAEKPREAGDSNRQQGDRRRNDGRRGDDRRSNESRNDGRRGDDRRRSGGNSRDYRSEGGYRPERGGEERIVAQDTTAYTRYVPGQSECDGAKFVSGVLERMGLDAGLGFSDEGDTLKIKIDSDAMGILIGHRGETLDAMQYLTGLVVNRGEDGYKRVTLDTENYRNKREETLGRLARKLAGQVRASGKPVTLEPMNPYERRVLHFALQNNPFVTTHSEGEEPNRYVVIAPKSPAKDE